MKAFPARTPIRWDIRSGHLKSGFTLMEISLVIALILGLTTFIGFSVTAISAWQRGKNAGLGLQAVYATQRAYMADHPTADMATVTSAQLQVYLPSGWTAMPTFKGLDDESLTLDHTVMPPKLLLGSAVYDPSGKSSDGLWDAGQ